MDCITAAETSKFPLSSFSPTALFDVSPEEEFELVRVLVQAANPENAMHKKTNNVRFFIKLLIKTSLYSITD
ncbi:MAG: hypothetical protein ACR2LT_08950 [Pyrinomonadaceae bacterium]